MNLRRVVIAAVIALVAAAVTVHPALDALEGLSIDALHWLRYEAYGRLHPVESSPSAVIAIDEETFRAQPFADVPRPLWTPQLARVLRAVREAGATVIGFDAIFPTSIERFVPGYERDFLVELRRAANQDKIVLGKVQHQLLPIRPFPGQSFAVGHQKNIRSVNLFRDSDDVIRRVPLRFQSDDIAAGARTETSMTLELAARALGVAPADLPDGGIALGSWRIPGSQRNAMPLNFDSGAADAPTFPLSDLFACAEAGNADYFRAHFAGKVVLLGAVLDVEDRKVTSKRFITGRESERAMPRCATEPVKGLYNETLQRDEIPGVYIQATAVNNLLRQDALRELDPLAYAAVTVVIALIAAFATIFIAPVLAAAALGVAALAWVGAATVAFRGGLVLPLLDPLAAAAIAAVGTIIYRTTIADRDTRWLRRTFGLYVSPAVVAQLSETQRLPALGGETREVTILFSDLEGFTAISEGLSPDRLVALMNRYLGAMTDVVEAHGGFVDKYIGDGILAVFGAPLADAAHARNAVSAALACQRALDELDLHDLLPSAKRLVARIGINTGEVLVGNIGSARRFNYTVMGDAVNLASRLEGANKQHGTRILISETTANALADTFELREIDTITVKGREQPVRVYEPIGYAAVRHEAQTAVPDPAHRP